MPPEPEKKPHESHDHSYGHSPGHSHGHSPGHAPGPAKDTPDLSKESFGHDRSAFDRLKQLLKVFGSKLGFNSEPYDPKAEKRDELKQHPLLHKIVKEDWYDAALKVTTLHQYGRTSLTSAELRSFVVYAITRGAPSSFIRDLTELAKYSDGSVKGHGVPIANYEEMFRQRLQTRQFDDTRDILRCLKLFERHRAFLGETALQSIMNNQDPNNGRTALHTVVGRNSDLRIIERILSLGADVRVPCSWQSLHGGPDSVKGTTLLHMREALIQPNLVKLFIQHGANVNAKDALGRTPLQVHLEPTRRWQFEKQTAAALLEAGANPTFTNAEGKDSITQAISRGSTGIALKLMNKGAPVPENMRDRSFKISEHGIERKVDFAGLLTATDRIANNLGQLPMEEMGRLVSERGNLYHGYLYAQAYKDAIEEHPPRESNAFIELLPHLMFTYSSENIKYFMRQIEMYMDMNPDQREHHPLESEMLLLLNHHNASREFLGTLSKSITSITRFLEDGMYRIPGKLLDSWARCGVLTYSFQCWRFDAEQPHEVGPGGKLVSKPSLLEQYGFERVPPRPTDSIQTGSTKKQLYGSGYLLQPGSKRFSYPKENENGKTVLQRFDPKTFVEFRRAYLLISHPEYGTLLIRNSSPDFGKDAFEHPVYWSQRGIGKGFTKDQLLNLDDKLLFGHFHNFLETEMYRHKPATTGHLHALTEQLMAIKGDYARWKFDTRKITAFDLDEVTDKYTLLGGFHSDGFSNLVKYVTDRHAEIELDKLTHGSSSKLLPQLAFVNPRYPPWVPYEFSAADGTTQQRLTVTAEVAAALKHLVDGTVTEEELQRTGLRSFFQQAGFNKQAEIVLLDPRGDYVK